MKLFIDVLLSATTFIAASLGIFLKTDRKIQICLVIIAAISSVATVVKSYYDDEDKKLFKYALISNLKVTEKNKALIYREIVNNFAIDDSDDIDYRSTDDGILFYNRNDKRPFAVALGAEQLAPIVAKIFAAESFKKDLEQAARGSFKHGFEEEKYNSYMIVGQGIYESTYAAVAKDARYDDRLGIVMIVGEKQRKIVFTADEIEKTVNGDKYHALGLFCIFAKEKLEREIGMPKYEK